MSENWITLADTDVFAPDAAERLTIAAIKREDDLSAICAQVTQQIRQAYQLSNRELGDDGKIPEGLKLRAIAIATWRFVSEKVARNPVFQTKERESAYKEALDFLNDIASLKLGTATSPSIKCRPRRFDHCDQDGI